MKPKYVPVRMDEELLAALDAKVKEVGARWRSELIREALEDYLAGDKAQKRRKYLTELSAWRKELHNEGVNLNQIAYKLNADHPLSTEKIMDTQESLRQLFSIMVRNFRSVEDDFRR
nr:ribbon-helix-helix domain-containing protein [Pseudodesulfovibrio sp.]